MASYSLYHEIHTQYKSTHDGTLLEAVNSSSLYQALQSITGIEVNAICFGPSTFTHRRCTFKKPGIIVHQYELRQRTHVSGLLFIEMGDRRIMMDYGRLDFRSYFALILLMQPGSQSLPKMSITSFANEAITLATTQASVEKVCGVFEKHLLFQGPEKDQWHLGQAIFREKVHYYVEQRSKIRFCLPAFPCKSSNPDKVASLWPDGAEYEALTNLFTFCVAVRAVYPPGAILEIVSDGHVFSDCVGVDDSAVSEYTRRLRIMAAQVARNMSTSTCNDDIRTMITFQGLSVILYPNHWVQKLMKVEFASLNTMIHPVNTKRTPHLEKVVRTDPSSSLTMLYRGFSRFMLDDLKAHPDGQDKSKSQRKKLAETVALEMMRRNQAYSHLVELVMPRQVRLSIHAHNNSGPKFAVSLLPKRKFRPLTSFDGIRISTEDDQYDERHHLHIPTPWHNAIVEIYGDERKYICKAGLVRAELNNRATSAWSEKSGYCETPRGGRFILYRKPAIGALLDAEWPTLREV